MQPWLPWTIDGQFPTMMSGVNVCPCETTWLNECSGNYRHFQRKDSV